MVRSKSLSSRSFDLLNIAFMLLLVVVMLYPFWYVAVASISNAGLVAKGEVMLWPKGLTLEAYRRVLSDSTIWISFGNTVKYTLVQTFLTLIFTAITAYPLSRKRLLFRRKILLFIAFTMLFHGGLIPSFLLVKKLGMLNSMWALIIPGLISTWHLFVMRTFFENLPDELEEAGIMDGAGPVGILFRIVVPLSLPIILTIGLFTAVGQWNSFFDALIYLQDKDRFPLQIILRNIVIAGSAAAQAEAGGEEVVILDTIKYAVIMVATLPIIGVYPFIQKYFVQGVMVGGIKG